MRNRTEKNERNKLPHFRHHVACERNGGVKACVPPKEQVISPGSEQSSSFPPSSSESQLALLLYNNASKADSTQMAHGGSHDVFSFHRRAAGGMFIACNIAADGLPQSARVGAEPLRRAWWAFAAKLMH
jgi:hypothetical protein